MTPASIKCLMCFLRLCIEISLADSVFVKVVRVKLQISAMELHHSAGSLGS